MMNTRCGLNYFLISTGLDPAPLSKLDPCPCANVGKVDIKSFCPCVKLL